MRKVNYDHLLPLLQAGCEDDVVTVCQRAINHQNIEDQDVTITMSLLAIDRDSAISVLQCLRSIVQDNQDVKDSTKILAKFPKTFPVDISSIVAKATVGRKDLLDKRAHRGPSCVPRLVDFGWRVDVNVGPDSKTKMAERTGLLHLKIQEPSLQEGQVKPVSTVNIELTSEGMKKVLEGIDKIRDQLLSIAK